MDIFTQGKYFITGKVPENCKAVLFQFDELISSRQSSQDPPETELIMTLENLVKQNIYLGITSLQPYESVKNDLERIGIGEFFSDYQTCMMICREHLISTPTCEPHLLTHGFLTLLKESPFSYQEVIFIGTEEPPLSRLHDHFSFELCTVLLRSEDPIRNMSSFIFSDVVPSMGKSLVQVS